MSNFPFAINATLPIFLVMVLGRALMQLGLFNKAFTEVADRYVFRIALPLLLFHDIATTDLRQDFNLRFFLFCMAGTTVMFLGTWLVARLALADKTLVGAFSQAAARSSAAILGIAFVTNIYGNPGQTPMMIVAAVPLFNILSVVILAASAKDNLGGTGRIRHTCLSVLTNPIILGIAAGVPFSLLGIRLPVILAKTVTSVGGTATPIALLVVGAGFEGRRALARLGPTVFATAIKLVLLPAIFIPLAVRLGFSRAELVAILIMTGSPTTVSCYIMAKNMGNDEVLSSSIIVLATLLSPVTLTGWLYLLRCLGLV